MIVLGRTGLEVLVHDHVDERDQELVLVTDALDFHVGVEHLGLVQAQAFHDVLVGMGVDGLFKGLAQQILAALRRGDMAVGAEHNVVGSQAVGGDEEAQVAGDDAALVRGQTIRVLPLGDVAAHIDFLRHPVIGAAGQILFPGPLVLERHQLVHVGGAVDDALVLDTDAAMGNGRSRCGCGRFSTHDVAPVGRRGGLQAGRGLLAGLGVFKTQHYLSPYLSICL